MTLLPVVGIEAGWFGARSATPFLTPIRYFIHRAAIFFFFQDSVLSEICSYFPPQPRQPHPASCDLGLLPGPRGKDRSSAGSCLGRRAVSVVGRGTQKQGHLPGHPLLLPSPLPLATHG